MTLTLFRRVELKDGCSYTRRLLFFDPEDTAEHPPFAARDMELLLDTDDEEPVITLPYDGTDEQFDAEDMRRCTMISIKAQPGEQYQPSSGDFYVASSRPSLTAPDRFWEFRCVRDPFEHVDGETGGRFNGSWEATQSPNKARLPFIVSNDAMTPDASVQMPHMPPMYADQPPVLKRAFFVKISSTEYLAEDRSGNLVKKQDTPTTYIALVSETMSSHVNHTRDTKFPSLETIIGDIDDLGNQGGQPIGLTPSSIVDISISERSPFEIRSTMDGADVLGPDGPLFFRTIGDRGFGMHMVNGWVSAVRSETLQWPGLSEMQYYTGAVSLYDTNDSKIAALPVQIMEEEASVSVDTIMDLTGIITQITLPGGSRITMPEGKLPYAGSAWSEYAIAQRSYDRENMTLAIQNARSEATQNILMNAANGVLTGSLVGGPLGLAGGIATTALGIAGTGMELQRNERTARAQQDMKEKMLMNTPGTSFNTGYGTDYVRRSLMGACRLQIDKPKNLDRSVFDGHVKMHGYPAGGLYCTAHIRSPGYIRGTAYEDLDMRLSEHDMNRMNKELIEGVRFT